MQFYLKTFYTLGGLSTQCLHWVNAYILTYTHMYACKFQAAINAIVNVSNSDVGFNEMFLVLLGQCYHYIGQYDLALHYLLRSQNRNSYLSEGLMTLASIYSIENKLDELEKLTMPNISPSEYTAEYWFVLAQHLYCQGKHDKAAYFAQKSCSLKPKNTEATLLKGLFI